MEKPNAAWNNFSTRVIQRDLSYQVSSNLLNVEEQTKDQLVSLGEKKKNLRSELHEYRVNALENSRQTDTNQKGRQNATRFCNYCRTNGHTPSCCRKKVRNEDTKRVQNGTLAEKRVTFTNDYNKRRRSSHGSGQFTYNNTGSRNQARRDMTDAQQSTYEEATQFFPRNVWGNPARNNSFNSGRGRSFDQHRKQFANRNEDKYQRNGSTGTSSRGTRQNIGTNPRSASGPRRDPRPSRHC